MEKNMRIAFILNLLFSAVELVGGFFTGSVAILSDALHDLGDALTIGISCLFEKKSNQKPDRIYTYGYRRYSVLAGFFSTLILCVGSVAVIFGAVGRIISPKPLHYDSMIGFAILGVIVNACAAYFTREGGSVNQRAVNLHMLEDVLGWVTVLFGALVMKFTGFSLLDPLMSIGVSVFLLIHAGRNLKEALDLFLEKAPQHISTEEITTLLRQIPGVADVHHVHLWSLDETANYATLHLVTDEDPHQIKHAVRELLQSHGIGHVTLELETSLEHCHEKCCTLTPKEGSHHHHHHH